MMEVTYDVESWIDLGHLEEPLRLAILPADPLALDSLHISYLFDTSGSHGRTSLSTARKRNRSGLI